MKPVFNFANQLFVLEKDFKIAKEYCLSNKESNSTPNYVVAREQNLSGELYRLLLEDMGAKTRYRPVGNGSDPTAVVAYAFFDNLETTKYVGQRLIETFGFSIDFCGFKRSRRIQVPHVGSIGAIGEVSWYGIEFEFAYVDYYSPEFSVEVAFHSMNSKVSMFLDYLMKDYSERAIDTNIYCFKNLWEVFEIISNYQYSK